MANIKEFPRGHRTSSRLLIINYIQCEMKATDQLFVACRNPSSTLARLRSAPGGGESRPILLLVWGLHQEVE